MGTIEEIITAIDDYLIESGKDYLVLGTANQLLMSKKIITVDEKLNKNLKELLEENKIPHAYQTEISPRQWRIPLSEDGKKRKRAIKKKRSSNQIKLTKESDQIFCANCGQNISVPPKLLKTRHIECPTCGYEFINPLEPEKKSYDNKTNKKARNRGIIVLIIIILAIIGYYSNNNSTSSSKVINSPYDSSVSQVEHYLKNNLKDPDSYESIEWSSINEEPEGGAYKYKVRHKYRAKNSFGGYVVENKVFYLDADGNVIGCDDY